MIKKRWGKKKRRKGLRSETSGTRRSATLLANDRRSRADSGNVRKNGLWIFCVARPLTNDARIWKRDGVATPCVIGWATRCADAPLPSPGICFIARFIIFRARTESTAPAIPRHGIHFSPLWPRQRIEILAASGNDTAESPQNIELYSSQWTIFNSSRDISRYLWKILFSSERKIEINRKIQYIYQTISYQLLIKSFCHF